MGIIRHSDFDRISYFEPRHLRSEVASFDEGLPEVDIPPEEAKKIREESPDRILGSRCVWTQEGSRDPFWEDLGSGAAA